MGENKSTDTTETAVPADADVENPNAEDGTPSPEEFGGPKGPEPTRYNDWEQKGRCTDF